MESEDMRERLRKQRQNWLRERDIHNNKEGKVLAFFNFKIEVEREIGRGDAQNQQIPQSNANVLNSELADRLFVKMSEKLEQKYQNGTNYKKSNKFNNQQVDADFEETLHNQVMSNTCPICFELFLPPDNQPYIIFPCGHTFCKQCINSYAKQKNKCPFCRSKIKSMAPNISLQNLILSANDKKDEVVKRLKQKQDQMIKNNQFSSSSTNQAGQQVPNTDVNPDKYLNDFRMYDIRCQVLEEERIDCIQKFQNAKINLSKKEQALGTLQQEKEDCIERLKKVQRELELIKEFQEKEESHVEVMRQEVSRLEQNLKFIDDSLNPLKAEKDKARLMISTISPNLLKDLY